MNQNKFSFESENLVVDYISFKFQYLDNFTQTEIANYLLKLGFNSYQESGKLAKPIQEPILVNKTCSYKAVFVHRAPFWEGTVLHFSGPNASVFYSLVQKKLIDWKIFSSGILSRFDLYYSRNNKTDDKSSTRDFLQDCQKQLEQTNKNVQLEKNSKGCILKIGNRSSNNYFRIYETKNSLKFEHEMKGKFLQSYHSLLVSNNLKNFEQRLTKHYFHYLGRTLPLRYSYLDWLAIRLRLMRKKITPHFFLNSDYIESEMNLDTKTFVMLIKFLNYVQYLDFEIQYLYGIPYRQVSFKLRDFLEFQDPTIKPRNHYQLEKIKKFFKKLQKEVLSTSFSDTSFQSLVAMPQIKLEKCSKQKCWIGTVCLVEELFYYKYPFCLPDFFKQKFTKHEFEVRVKVFKTFSSINTEKVFLIKDFFQNYKSILSNQQKTKMKIYFIELVKVLQNHSLIEDNYKTIWNGSFCDTKELNINNISEGFIIFEKLSI
jgi:hypothetical protein